MPLPLEALAVQQGLIDVQRGVLSGVISDYADAVALQVSDPSEQHEADEAAALVAVLVERRVLGDLVGGLALILAEDRSYQPPSVAAQVYDLVFQVAYALSPGV